MIILFYIAGIRDLRYMCSYRRTDFEKIRNFYRFHGGFISR